MADTRAFLAEGISTFALVFFGTLSVTIAAAAFGVGLSPEAIILISFAHGSVIALMVYAFGHVSGAHINPAVTIGILVAKKIAATKAAGYIAFQITGAVLGAYAHMIFVPLGESVKYGVQTGPSELIGGSALSAVGIEAIMTFFLVAVIFMTAVRRGAAPGVSGLAIGGTIFLVHLVGIALTGASVNPARTFGPALVSGFWEFHWVYWVGPMLGAAIAALLMKHVFLGGAKKRL